MERISARVAVDTTSLRRCQRLPQTLTSCSVFADGFWEELSKYAEYREPDVLAILPQPQLSVDPVAPLRC